MAFFTSQYCIWECNNGDYWLRSSFRGTQIPLVGWTDALQEWDNWIVLQRFEGASSRYHSFHRATSQLNIFVNISSESLDLCCRKSTLNLKSGQTYSHWYKVPWNIPRHRNEETLPPLKLSHACNWHHVSLYFYIQALPVISNYRRWFGNFI